MRTTPSDYPEPSELGTDRVVVVPGWNETLRKEIVPPAPDYRDPAVWAKRIEEGAGLIAAVTPEFAYAIGDVVREHSEADAERLRQNLVHAFDDAYAKLPRESKAKHGPRSFAKFVHSRLASVLRIVFSDLTDREMLEKRRKLIYEAHNADPTDREIRKTRNSVDELTIGLDGFLTAYNGEDPLNVGIIARNNLAKAIRTFRTHAKTHPDELRRKPKGTAEAQEKAQSGVGAVLNAPISHILTTRVSELVRGKVRPTGKRPFGKRP